MPWPSSRFQDLFQIDVPIVQAPMAGAQLSPMTIAVCEAGALGSLPCALLSAEQLRRELDAIRAATAKPFNVNFFCHRAPPSDTGREARWHERFAPYYTELGLDPAAASSAAARTPFDETMCAIVEEYKPAVISFHFGLPDEGLLDRVKKTGAKILSSATTVDEGRWLVERGCDAIIAQGLEAGGHRGLFLTENLTSQLATLALVPLLVDAVPVPVIATGGIMDGRGIAAAFALGASGVQLGTAYLFCPEATITSAHREALRRHDSITAITNVMTGRPARGIVNRVMRELGPMTSDAPSFPLAATPLAPLRVAAEQRGSGDFSPLWAGQAFALGREMPAAALTTSLARSALEHLATIAGKATDASAAFRERAERANTSPVGMTARWIAASRAVESTRADALFRDPLASDLAGEEGVAMRKAMSGSMSTSEGRDPHLAIRTRFFDDALRAAVEGQPAPQVLILAAGMDSRAFRLDWPAGTVLYEVDRPEIFDYKEPIIERLGAEPRCARRVVRADLAGDWTPAVMEAGFDKDRVTAVLVEGLVMYLDEASALRLFETLRAFVPAGSWIGMDIINKEMLTSPYTAPLMQLLEKMGCPWKFAVSNAESFLEEQGWEGTLSSPGDPDANYGFWPFPPVPRNFPNMPRSFFVRATRRS